MSRELGPRISVIGTGGQSKFKDAQFAIEQKLCDEVETVNYTKVCSLGLFVWKA
jgi:hypothetical protein